MDDELDLSDALLYLSDSRGVYIPQNFAQQTKRECVTGIDDDDWNYLLAGPDHECYWDAWCVVCDDAIVTDPNTGIRYSVYQDGDCWLVPIKTEE